MHFFGFLELFFFVGKTDEEISLVCKTQDAPPGASAREDGWRGFRVRGVLDFSLIGVLSKLMEISEDEWMQTIEETVPPKFLEMNKKAFLLGFDAATDPSKHCKS